IFTLEISEDKLVNQLKPMIRKWWPNRFQHIDPSKLILYKVLDVNIALGLIEPLKKEKAGNKNYGQRLHLLEKICIHFNNDQETYPDSIKPNEKRVSIVIGGCETNVNLSLKIFDHRDETSKPSTSTSEIQTNIPEPSQLEVLALNYLRNQKISTIPSRILKLNPCSICQRNYIMQAETDPFTLICLSYNVIIELTREEAVLASGKYHLQKKQTDTEQGNEDLMASLGLVEGGSRVGQRGQSKQVTMQDQATSPIMFEDDDDNQSNSVDNRTPENQANSNDEICATNTQDNLENQSNANSGDDTNMQESESQSRRNSSRRRTSPRITREQKKFQALLQELSTPAKGERAENVDEKEDADGSVSQSLA
ncbi:6755_t:CDS:2, partial [Funneliformis mosseae]